MVEKTLESEFPDTKPLLITLRTKTKITIHPFHIDFFEKLQQLPASEKIELMQLTNVETRAHFQKLYRSKLSRVTHMLKKTWYWKETGDPVDFSTTSLLHDGWTIENICKRPKNDIILDLFIEFFEGDNTEVYIKSNPE